LSRRNFYKDAIAEELGYLPIEATGPDIGEFEDAATVTLALVSSGVDVYEPAGVTDAETVPLALIPSGVEEHIINEDAATAQLTLSPSGTDEAVFVDANSTGTLRLTPSGVDVVTRVYSDSSTIALLLKPDALEYQALFNADPVGVLSRKWPSDLDDPRYVAAPANNPRYRAILIDWTVPQ
jgi:hypothetical protein